jgi:serine/threonine-protein kinase
VRASTEGRHARCSGASIVAPTQRQTTARDDDAYLAPAPPSVPHADLFQPGEVLSGIYEIQAKMAEGATGQVYAAWDRDELRTVAVQASYPYLGLDAADAARSHGGVQYVVTELVSLESVVRARKEAYEAMPLEEAVDILARVAEALAVVHRAGNAHRDIRPANILLAPDGHVVLTDFEPCQPEQGGEPDPHVLPHYMAPEAIRRRIAPGRMHLVDVYSLGVMAFELIAGRLPYAAACPMRLLVKHLQQPVPDPREARRGVPPELADLIRQMLAKDPLSRPQSMEEIGLRLRQR